MPGKLCMGTRDVPNDAMLSRALCEGRAARFAGAARDTNPHVADTPDYRSWDRGWATYEAGGTLVKQDCCAIPITIADRTMAGVETDLSVEFTVTPAIPCQIDPGDGSDKIPAPLGIASHLYAAEGTYTAIAYFGDLKIAETSVSPTEPTP